MSFDLKKFLSQKEHIRVISFLLIVIINIIVFYPSFFHVARHDQLLYLGDAAGDHNWLSLAVKRAIQYNRDHHLFAGHDPVLFRPLFYSLLGTELWLFGYNFIYWQITGLLIHLFVVWMLFGLLMRIRPSFFAWLLTLFFSVLYADIEMVIWHHINIYMVFIACLLICFRAFYEILDTQSVQAKQAWTIFFSLTVASFIYDTVFLCAILFFILAKVFLSPQRDLQSQASKHWRLMIIAPAVFFACLNLISLLSTGAGASWHKYQTATQAFSAVKAIGSVFASFWWWTSSGLLPELLKPELSERIVFYYNGAFLRPDTIFSLNNILSVGFLALIGAVISYAIILKRSLSKSFIQKRGAFLLLVLGAWLIQIVVLALGRVSIDSIDILANCSYYNYLFWPYPIILLYALVDPNKELYRQRPLNIKNLSIAFLVILIVINASRTFSLNDNYRKICAKQYLITKKTEALVKAHKNEKNFSFMVDPSDLYYLPWIHKKPMLPDEEPYFYSQMLYPHLIKKDNSKYIVGLTEPERQETFRLFLEGTIENFMQRPFPTWNADKLKYFLVLMKVYVSEGRKEKALKMIDTALRQKPKDERLRQLFENEKDLLRNSF